MPVGTWTTKYKEFLETMLPGYHKGNDKKKKDKNSTPAAPILKDMEENHTDTKVSETCQNDELREYKKIQKKKVAVVAGETYLLRFLLETHIRLRVSHALDGCCPQVSFLLTLQPNVDFGEDLMSNKDFLKQFKLTTSVSESNMVLVNGTVQKFRNTLDIMEVSAVKSLTPFGDGNK